MNLYIIESNSYNPHENLAFEEALLNSAKEDDVWLYLWQNEKTVVIGRHQNPWVECSVELLNKDGGTLARRTSGGGAVFHDLGNLNFSFIVGNTLYDLQKQLSVIINMANLFGIEAEFTGRNDITVDTKKFSGNAFALGKNATLHHGTLLIDVDKEKLGKYLQPNKLKLKAKGVTSVKARICNLNEYGKIDIESAKKALNSSFERIYGKKAQYIDFLEKCKEISFDNIARKHASKEWLYGKTPKFDVEIENRFEWGCIEILLSLVNGKIKKATCYSDAMEVEFIDEISLVLEGIEYSSNKIYQAIAKIDNEKAKELASFIRQEISWGG